MGNQINLDFVGHKNVYKWLELLEWDVDYTQKDVSYCYFSTSWIIGPTV